MFRKLVCFIDSLLFPQRVKANLPCNQGFIQIIGAALAALAKMAGTAALAVAKGAGTAGLAAAKAAGAGAMTLGKGVMAASKGLLTAGAKGVGALGKGAVGVGKGALGLGKGITGAAKGLLGMGGKSAGAVKGLAGDLTAMGPGGKLISGIGESAPGWAMPTAEATQMGGPALESMTAANIGKGAAPFQATKPSLFSKIRKASQFELGGGEDKAKEPALPQIIGGTETPITTPQLQFRETPKFGLMIAEMLKRIRGF